jgi:hypothetical protein
MPSCNPPPPVALLRGDTIHGSSTSSPNTRTNALISSLRIGEPRASKAARAPMLNENSNRFQTYSRQIQAGNSHAKSGGAARTGRHFRSSPASGQVFCKLRQPYVSEMYRLPACRSFSSVELVLCSGNAAPLHVSSPDVHEGSPTRKE